MTDKMAQHGENSSLRHWLDRQMQAAQSGKEEAMTVDDIQAAWSPRFDAMEIAEVVIPRRTLARRKATRTNLTQDETDRAVRLALIQVEADRVFANAEKSSKWLRRPNQRLSGQTPLSVLRSEAGAILVLELLGQIDNGMFA